MTVFNKNAVNTTKQFMFFGAPLSVQRYDQYKFPTYDAKKDGDDVDVDNLINELLTTEEEACDSCAV